MYISVSGSQENLEYNSVEQVCNESLSSQYDIETYFFVNTSAFDHIA